MTGRLEWLRWLRDAEQSLAGARRAREADDARNACVLAQQAIELSCKALVALFAEPQWTHDPADQLRESALARGDDDLESLLGNGARTAIERVARDVHEAAPWHGWATYGRKLPDQTWLAAVDVCTPTAAADLLGRAEHAVAAAARLRARLQTPDSR
jgi:HEPN domain-containing protein